MSNFNFDCPKCDSKNTFIKKNGNQTGLYCGDCGKWIKWLSKNEIVAFEHEKATERESKENNFQEINPDEIQCSGCGFLGDMNRDWLKIDAFRVCPKCGSMRVVMQSNRLYRKEG